MTAGLATQLLKTEPNGTEFVQLVSALAEYRLGNLEKAENLLQTGVIPEDQP
jgi:hypothetical protein